MILMFVYFVGWVMCIGNVLTRDFSAIKKVILTFLVLVLYPPIILFIDVLGGILSSKIYVDVQSILMAGATSANCGRTHYNEDPVQVTSCALQSFNAGLPFRTRYDLQGIDSIVAVSLIGTQDGSLLELRYDSDPSGSFASLSRQRVTVVPCPRPYQLRSDADGRVDCFPQRQRNIMSPELAPDNIPKGETRSANIR